MKKTTFYTILVFILFILKPNNNFAIGTFGSYILTGHALTKSGDTLRNEVIIVFVNNELDTLVTDSNGIYKTTINWNTACPTSIIPWPQRWKDNKLNSKYIYFTFKNTKIKIKNDWKIMMALDTNYPDLPTKIQDLIFY